MSTTVFAFPGNEALARVIAERIDASIGTLFLHRFPDGETYVRLDTDVNDGGAIFICTLNEPDAKLLPLLFAAGAARDQGARRVGIVAPYLAYLRQDTRFKPGEAITSRTFARLVSGTADWILTVDPHLHRYGSLAAVYSIATRVVHTAPLISQWVRANVSRPLLIGPDSESEQWVAEVANAADAPYVVLEKTRRGDREVEVSIPDVARHRDRTPVLIDDIVSTARTMIAAIARLRAAALPPPVCVVVHALFAGDAYPTLEAAGATRIVSCNTVPHASNGIDVNEAIADCVREWARRW
ncbi:MAG: ribose-phosphate pyrophosphokinase [Proteobacteria bacterium]|nr:ribose-phosphate pyrophosphokinase [Pseudomonadota bacterium]